MRRCPICKKEVAPRTTNRWFPFCTERCKLVDLGKWLGEEYRVPSAPGLDDDEELPEVPDSTQHDA